MVVSTHALFVVLAVFAGTLLAVARAREPSPVLGVAPFAAVAALAGSHLLFRVQHGGPGGLWSGGLGVDGRRRSPCARDRGGGPGSRRRLADLADAVAPAGILALGIGRLGCSSSAALLLRTADGDRRGP